MHRTRQPIAVMIRADDGSLVVIRQEPFDVRTVCVQFQPDRATAVESRVRQAFREALPAAKVVAGEEDGRYENIMFNVDSPEEAMSKLRAVFDASDIGRAARSSCIVTCQGEHGWDDYLLLHHYDRTMVLDAPAARPAE